MHLTSFIETTAFRLIDAQELRKVFLPDLAEAVREKFKFVEYPKSVDNYLSQDGLSFRYGTFEQKLIGELMIYNDGVIIKAPHESVFLDGVIDTLVRTLAAKFKAKIPDTSTRFYNSRIEVKAAAEFGLSFDVLQPIITALKNAMAKNGMEIDRYETFGFTLGGEGEGLWKPGRFTFERRANMPLADSMFYSEAPLSTTDHLSLLTDLEALF